MSIRAGIAINRGAGRSRDSRQRLQTPKTALDGEIHQIFEDGPSLRRDVVARCRQPLAAVTQHDPPEAAVRNDQVRAAANHHRRQAARARRFQRGHERLDIAGFRIEIGRAADAEACVAGKRDPGQNG